MSDGPHEPDPTELPSTEAVPAAGNEHQQIGPYRLLQKLGEGGMGEVWLAEQSEPVKRRVALKIIKQGMDTKQVVARFEAERQALAMMDHPAVAKVFDAGTTPRGRPFFVMECVKGVPITEHCDRHKLTTRERLELFCEVCEGVQHAHQKAIIHRDLKPTNVLVVEQDSKRLAKIIDFGVAKATAQKLTEKTVYTELGVLIGTPEYMSPEQAELTGEDVDTRTDVYSLGVMLYELLVGALPFDSKELRSGGYEGIRKRIREEEPHKPSTRLSTLGDRSTANAERRRVDLPTLQRQLRGDLDWITMRALEKDRSRRYGSPQELQAEIRRHLRHEPVEAGPPSTMYRVGKFVRRHRVGVAVSVAAVLLVIGFAVREWIQSSQIAAERDRANREREASDRVSEFLADMLGDVDPQMLGVALWKDLRERVTEVRKGRAASDEEIEAALANLSEALSGVSATDVALQLLDKQVLARAGQTIEQQLAEEPLVAARLEHTLGKTYRRLGLHTPAERHASRAHQTRRQALGADHADTLSSMASLASLYQRLGRYDEAERLHLETLERRRRVLGSEHPETLESMGHLAILYLDLGRYDESETLTQATLALRQRLLGSEHPQTLQSMHLLAMVYGKLKWEEKEEQLALETLDARRRVLGDDHPSTMSTRNNLAIMYMRQRRYAEAESMLLDLIEDSKRVRGDEHPSTLLHLSNLRLVYARQGRHTEAESLGGKVLEVRKRVFGVKHVDTIHAMVQQGMFLMKYGERYDEAAVLFHEALDTLERVLGDGHYDTNNVRYLLADLEASRGNTALAMNWLRQAVDAGFADADLMIRDSDLVNLHGSEFDAFVEQARKNAAAQRED